MSRYVVSGYDKRMRIMVGFSRDYGYWYVGHEEGVDRAVMQSDPDAVKTLHELVRATWGVVDWTREQSTLRRLRDDPWKEQAGVSGRDAEVSAVLVRALRAG